MSVQFAAATSTSIPVHVIDQNNLDAWTSQQTPMTQAWVVAKGFNDGLNEEVVVPGSDGGELRALDG